jgi:hypothetical protein
MTVERQHGMILFICDNCGEDFDSDTDEFMEAVTALKDEGWKIAKNEDDDWVHFCPGCK